jgi:hypothetical protein
MEPLDLLILLGVNLFGVYALYKIGQIVYWYLKDRSSKKEQF